MKHMIKLQWRHKKAVVQMEMFNMFLEDRDKYFKYLFTN